MTPRRRSLYAALASALAAGSVLLGGVLANAGTHLVVDSTTDAVDSRAGDGVCRTFAGACTLRAAIQEANALPGADHIDVPAGTYELGIPPLNQNDATTGDLDITDSLTISGAGTASTFIDGGTPPAGAPPQVHGLDRLFEVLADGGTVAFSGLTFRDGHASEYGGAIANNSTATVTVAASTLTANVAGKAGGAIDNHLGGSLEVSDSTLSGNFAYENGSALNNNRNGALTVTTSTVANNSAAAVGLDEALVGAGAISNNAELDTAGTITVTGSQISDNRAGGGRAGATISNDGAGTVVVEGTTFAKNRATGDGGAIFNGSGEVTVADSTFLENAAADGGAIYSEADKNGRVTVRGSTFVLNTASGRGGAVVGSGIGVLGVTDSTFSKNSADDWGGAILNDEKASATILSSSFSENSGLNGGGFANDGTGLVTVDSSTFTKNTAFVSALLASGEGGGMHTSSAGEVVVTGGAFTDNQARGGGGLTNEGGGTLVVTGTRFSGNRADEQGGGILIQSGAVHMFDIDVVGNFADSPLEAGGGIAYQGDKLVGIGETAAIEHSRIRDNTAKGPGGGIDSRGDGPLSIATSAITGNRAASGGAIHHVGDAPVEVSRSTVSGNFAESGGGAFTDGDGEATFENSTISGNRAGQFGGGLLVSSRLNVKSSTVASNTAASGGGINNGGGDLVGDGSVFLADTIVANSPTGGNCAGTMTSLGGNLESADSCQFRELTDQPGTDPRLGPLADNGGPTHTHALLAGSPAQERAVCTDVDPCPAVDQRGVERPRFAGFDVGAYESELAPGPGGGSQPCAGRSERPVRADFDSWVTQGAPAGNFGSDSILKVQSQGSANKRALVHFSLPPVPPGCKLVAATLKLHASAATDGRTLEALRVGSDWSELGVTWDNQPPVAGAAATTPSGLGSREWDVLAQTLDMYVHGDHGFLIRDADGNGPGEQSFHSAEKGADHPPELVLVFEDPDAPPPPGACPTTPQILSANQDSWVSEGSPSNNFGTDSTLKVKSQSGSQIGNNARTLIRFPLPTLPAGCTGIASATLRVEAASAKEGRTLDALQTASAWSETGVTWSNQPGTRGPAAATPSIDGTLEWVVTPHVEDMYTSQNHGFLIRDAEENGIGDEQTLQSRDKVNDGAPELLLVFDDSTPETFIDLGPASPTDSTDASFSFSSDREDASFECALDGAAFDACTSGHAVRGLAEGDHTFEVRATRKVRAVDPTPATYAWKVAIPPRSTIVGPASPSDSPDATLAFTADDSEASFECSLNGADFEGCTSPVEYKNLGDGPNEVRVRATDPLGNVEPTPATHAWTVAVPPAPAIDSGPERLTKTTGARFEFSGADNGPAPGPLRFDCRLDAGVWAACSSPQAYGLEPGDPPLGDGEHVFQVRATDAAGNVGAASYGWTVDTAVPVASIESGPDRLTKSIAASFEFSATDGGPAEPSLRFECRLDTGDWTACSSPQDYGVAALADGTHEFRVRATDGAGNVGEASYAWTVDTAAPVASIESGPDRLTNETAATFKFSATDGGPAEPPLHFECRLDMGDWAACSSPQDYGGSGAAALADGEHVFAVRATDGAGNVGEAASYEWTVDTAAPVARVDSGPGALTSRTAASFEFSATDQGPAQPPLDFQCSLDEGAWTNCTSPQTYGAAPSQPLGDGEHAFRVRATDGAGNVSAEEAYGWTVDTVAPVASVTSGPDRLTNSTEAAFEFSGSDEGPAAPPLGFQCRLDAGDWTSCSSPQVYGAGPGAAPLADGPHLFLVRAVDGAGNVGEAASHEWTVDTAAPVASIASGPDRLTKSTEASFAFGADEAATFECRLDAGDWVECSSPQGYGGAGAAALADGEHVIAVRARDGAGNVGQPAAYEWTVDTAAPLARVHSGPAALTNSSAASFEFSATDSGPAEPPLRFECQLDAGDWIGCSSPQVYGAGPGAVPLADGRHVFLVRATDGAGNVSEAAAYEWTVDTAAPLARVDSGPAALTNSTAASFDVSATDRGPAESPLRFECKLDAGDWAACTSPERYGGAGPAALADGEHVFAVRATDGAGNTGPAASYEWTVDTAAPPARVDNGPPALTNSTAASFAFGADEDATFECRLDAGDWVTCTSPQSYGGAGQTPLADGEHTFQVRATDHAGNQGGAASYSWTVDTVAPVTTIDNAPSNPSTDRGPSFEFSASEATVFECRLDTGDWARCTSPHSYTGLADGDHTFQVRATDPAGNSGSAAAYSWTVEPPRDGADPDTTITSGPPDPSTSTSATFSFIGTDNETPAAELRFECRIDSQDPAAFGACPGQGTYTGLGQGSHTFEVRAVDLAGNADETPASFSWTIDSIAPQTTIDSGPSGLTNDSTPTFAFASEAGAGFQCRVDSAAFAACTSPHTTTALGEGAHTFEVRASDAAGNVGGPASRAITVDTLPPQTTIDAGPTGPTNDSTPTFSFSSEPGASFQCRVDSAAFAACSSPHTTTALGEGAHTFEVRAGDAAGNTDASAASRAITVDTTAPQTTITSTPPATTSSTTATFSFTASETSSSFECSLDGSAFTACTSSRTYSGLAPGAHQFAVRARDSVGNADATAASYSWTIVAPPQGCGGAATALAAADAWIDENSPTSNKGTDSILKVQSKGPRDNFRALVRFSLPSVPQGCVVESATLRLYGASAREGRTLHALRLASAWSENQVSWGNQPQTTGPAAATAAGQAYREWTVTDHVQAMYADANHGFLIRDSVEGQDAEQQFHSREKGENPPQLVVRFASAGG